MAHSTENVPHQADFIDHAICEIESLKDTPSPSTCPRSLPWDPQISTHLTIDARRQIAKLTQKLRVLKQTTTDSPFPRFFARQLFGRLIKDALLIAKIDRHLARRDNIDSATRDQLRALRKEIIDQTNILRIAQFHRFAAQVGHAIIISLKKQYPFAPQAASRFSRATPPSNHSPITYIDPIDYYLNDYFQSTTSTALWSNLVTPSIFGKVYTVDLEADALRFLLHDPYTDDLIQDTGPEAEDSILLPRAGNTPTMAGPKSQFDHYIIAESRTLIDQLNQAMAFPSEAASDRLIETFAALIRLRLPVIYHGIISHLKHMVMAPDSEVTALLRYKQVREGVQNQIYNRHAMDTPLLVAFHEAINSLDQTPNSGVMTGLALFGALLVGTPALVFMVDAALVTTSIYALHTAHTQWQTTEANAFTAIFEAAISSEAERQLAYDNLNTALINTAITFGVSAAHTYSALAGYTQLITADRIHNSAQHIAKAYIGAFEKRRFFRATLPMTLINGILSSGFEYYERRKHSTPQNQMFLKDVHGRFTINDQSAFNFINQIIGGLLCNPVLFIGAGRGLVGLAERVATSQALIAVTSAVSQTVWTAIQDKPVHVDPDRFAFDLYYNLTFGHSLFEASRPMVLRFSNTPWFTAVYTPIRYLQLWLHSRIRTPMLDKRFGEEEPIFPISMRDIIEGELDTLSSNPDAQIPKLREMLLDIGQLTGAPPDRVTKWLATIDRQEDVGHL